MAVFSIDIPVYATFYIRADDEEEARKIAADLKGDAIELRVDEDADIPISQRQFYDPDLPELSMSPAMTVGDVEAGTDVEWCADEPGEETDDEGAEV